MPITVQHSPDFRLVGGVAYAAGLGQYAERRRQQDIAEFQTQQKIALEAQGQQARIEAANRAQQLQYMQMQNEAAVAQQRQALFAQQQAANQQQQQREFKGLQDWRDAQLDDNAAQRSAVADQANARQMNTWQQGGVSNLEAEVSDRIKELNKAELTPDGKALRGKLLGSLRAIQKQRTMLAAKPEAYNDLLTQWLNKHDESNIGAFVAPKLSAEERLKSQTVPVYDEDGKTIKGSWVVGEGKGTARYQPMTTPGAKSTATGGKPGANYVGVPFETFIADPKNFDDWRNDAIKTLTPPGGLDPEGPGLSEDKIEEQMRKRYERWQKMTAPKAAELPAVAPPVAKPESLIPRPDRPVSPQELNNLQARMIQEKLAIAKANGWVDRETTPNEFASRYMRAYEERAQLDPGQQAMMRGSELQASQPAALKGLPQHQAAIKLVLNAAGSDGALNMDRLISDANAEEVRSSKEGKPGAGQAKYRAVQSAIEEYKKIRQLHTSKAEFTPAQRQKMQALVAVFGPYMNAQ